MKYFRNISDLKSLRKEYRILAIKNHPDKGGDTQVMQNINAEFDILYSILLKTKIIESEKETGTETAQEYRKNFYTVNGWEGIRYNSNLSIKEVAARVRNYAKERWPGFKFSIRTQYYSGGASIHLTLTSGPISAIIGDREYISACSNVRGYKKELSKEVYDVVNDVCDYLQSYNYDDSDGMIDYFDVNFYTHINIGSWNKPYKIKKKNTAIESNEISGKEKKTAEREMVNPSMFMSFVSCVQKRIIKKNTKDARKYVKEYIQSYKLQIMQLRYIVYLISDAQQRLG